MMDKKGSKLSVALGITFVWFTTQFGGGFASGAQLKSYFIRFPATSACFSSCMCDYDVPAGSFDQPVNAA